MQQCHFLETMSVTQDKKKGVKTAHYEVCGLSSNVDVFPGKRSRC